MANHSDIKISKQQSMKHQFIIFVIILTCFSIQYLHGQPGRSDFRDFPINPSRSVLFADDIVINDQPGENQRKVTICSAYNGWLFAIYTYTSGNLPYLAVYRSADLGSSWTVLYADIIGVENSFVEKIDAVVLGNTVPDLRLAVGVLCHDSITGSKWAGVSVCNANTGAFEGDILNDQSRDVRDIALASDNLYPASGTNHNTFAVVYSMHEFFDSIVFCSSSNGGISFDTRFDIAYSPNYVHKVALAYGRSPSYPSGRYFAAWEEQENENSDVGHIYTAHSEPNYNSRFTSKVILDSINPSTANLARNPAIACQYNNVDNDSTNLTEVVLFEKYIQGENRYDIAGVYNLQAASKAAFHGMPFYPTSHNQVQADINFNPYDSSFMATFFDSTGKKLPMVENDFNLTHTDSWQLVNPGYNDTPNISAPNPRVRLNFGQHQRAVAWTAERIGGAGEALYDAQDHYYTGNGNALSIKDEELFSAYPNPCSSKLTFDFVTIKTENVTISLYDITGKHIKTILDNSFPAGFHQVIFDISSYPNGCYICKYHSGNSSCSTKINIIK